MNAPVWQCSCGGYTEIGRYFCARCGKHFSISAVTQWWSPERTSGGSGSIPDGAAETVPCCRHGIPLGATCCWCGRTPNSKQFASTCRRRIGFLPSRKPSACTPTRRSELGICSRVPAGNHILQIVVPSTTKDRHVHSRFNLGCAHRQQRDAASVPCAQRHREAADASHQGQGRGVLRTRAVDRLVSRALIGAHQLRAGSDVGCQASDQVVSSSSSLVPLGGTRRPSPRGVVLRGAFSQVIA